MARLIETTIEATGTTEGVDIYGEASLIMNFGASVAEIQVERKGPAASDIFQPFSDPFIGSAAQIITERIRGVQYRLNATSFTSGSIPVELGDK